MKITHWALKNGSGLAQVAEDLSVCEKQAGIESIVCDALNPNDVKMGMNADLHVAHAHIPSEIAVRHTKPWITVAHGAPEYVMETMATEDGLNQKGNSFAAGWMMMQQADAVVSFWDRHIKMYLNWTDKPIYKINMGVPLGFWQKESVATKQPGTPAFLTCENSVRSKWILDLLLLFPWLLEDFPDAALNCYYVPMMQHKMFYPILYATKAVRGVYISSQKLNKQLLLQTLRGSDYYLNLCRYGDFNQMGMQAKAAGCKVISYRGNPYADYWITEGDQRDMAIQLLAIMKGWTQPRNNVEPIPDTKDMVNGMLRVYQEVLKRFPTS